MTDIETENEQYWTDFVQTGSISSYLQYKGVLQTDKTEEENIFGTDKHRGYNYERN